MSLSVINYIIIHAAYVFVYFNQLNSEPAVWCFFFFCCFLFSYLTFLFLPRIISFCVLGSFTEQGKGTEGAVRQAI